MYYVFEEICSFIEHLSRSIRERRKSMDFSHPNWKYVTFRNTNPAN
jgi:hypothetical protein